MYGLAVITLAATNVCLALRVSTSVTSWASTRCSCWQVIPKSARAACRAGQLPEGKPAQMQWYTNQDSLVTKGYAQQYWEQAPQQLQGPGLPGRVTT